MVHRVGGRRHGVGLGTAGLLGFGVAGVFVPGVLGPALGVVVFGDGVELDPVLPSLRLTGTVPVPSGTSWVPLR